MVETRSHITFRALQLANEQRNAYGLRYNDLQRYRKHCANRTHRLRSTLKMTHGKGREFKKLPAVSTDKLKDGHLQLLLMEADRAWAHAQELIAESLKPANDGKASTLRHSATGRFRRAVHWATQLLSQCQALHAMNRLSATNLLEASVYTLILNGRFLRFRDEFEDALVQLSVARDLLDALAAAAGTSRDQALATLFADEIGPEIRYCAHELGREKAYDVDGIVRELGAQHRNTVVEGCDALLSRLQGAMDVDGAGETRKRLAELIWEGQPVPVRNPELVDVLLRVQIAEDKLGETNKLDDVKAQKKGTQGLGVKSKKGVAAYDTILLALSDAEDVARRQVEIQQLSGSGSSGSAPGVRDIHFVHAYIVYQLLSRRIQRDLLLTSTLLSSSPAQSAPSTKSTKPIAQSKPKVEHVDVRLYPAVVKLLDTVLQSLAQMRTLSIVDDSPDLAAAVDARVAYAKARRCLFLARCYTPMKRYAEALVLAQHASIHTREARASLALVDADPISEGNPAYFPLAPTDIDKLDAELSADALRAKQDWFAHNGGRLGDKGEHKKPTFFDIALNYVHMDADALAVRAGRVQAPAQAQKGASGKAKGPRVEEVERPETPVQQPQPQQKGGLGGLLGGWWGRS